MNVFASRTPRERMLIVAAAVLLGLFAIWQFAVYPVLSSKAQAEQAQKTALRDLDIVQRSIPKLTLSSNADRANFDRAAVITAARRSNVAISRMQPGVNDTLQVWFEDTDAPSIYKLLAELSSQFKVSIDRAQLTRRDTGFISAQVTLASH